MIIRNRKLNKSILTGLAAVTLFAPMVLHNTQANADSSQSSQVRTALQKDNFKDLTIKGSTNLDPSQMDESTINNVFGSLKNFASSYQSLPDNLKSSQTDQIQQLLKNTNRDTLSNVKDSDVMNYASAINQLANDVNNAVKNFSSLSNNNGSTNQTSQIQNYLNKYGNQNIQLADGQTLSDKKVLQMSDTDVNNLANQISGFATNYTNTQNNINNNNKTQMQAVVKNGDDEGSNSAVNSMSYDQANGLANDLNSLNTNVQGTLNQSGESSRSNEDKAIDVQNTLKTNKSQYINFAGGNKLDVTQLKPGQNENNDDINTILGIANHLSTFATNYKRAQQDMSSYQTSQLKSLFTNGAFSNSDYDTVSQAANDLNNLSNDYNNKKSNNFGTSSNQGSNSKEGDILNVLSSDSSQYAAYNGGKTDTTTNPTQADQVADSLSNFPSQYSDIANIGSSGNFSTLKSLIKSIDGNNQSGRSVDDVINTGIALNNVANDVKDIKSTSSKGTMQLQNIMSQYHIKSLNFGGNNSVTSDKVSSNTADNINSIQSITFDNSKQTSLRLHNSNGVDGLISAIRGAIQQTKDQSSANTNTRNTNNIKAVQDILTNYHTQSINFDNNNKVSVGNVNLDTVNNINNAKSITFNDSKNTTLGLSNTNGIKGLSSSIRNTLQQAQINSSKNPSNSTRHLRNIMNKYKVNTINFSNNVNVSADKVNAGIADNINSIQSITLNDNRATTLGLHNNNGLSSLSSNIRGAIQQNQQAAQSSNNSSSASSGAVVTTSLSNNSSSNNNSNISSNASNSNNSQATSFPAAPKTKKSSSHQTIKESKEAFIKNAKKDKSNIKSNQKQLDKVKKQLKKAKGKNNKAKANKELKQAEKALSHSKNQYNHAKKSLK